MEATVTGRGVDVTSKRLGGRASAWARRSTVVAAAIVAVGVVPISSAPAANTPGVPVITRGAAGPAAGAVLISWSLPARGGGPITDYKYTMSVDGGATWSRARAFGSPVRIESTVARPSFVCPNSLPGSKGCLYRIFAVNVYGTGFASKPVALWTVPDAPVARGAFPTDNTFSTMSFFWSPPVHTGGLPITGYQVSGSMDGGPKQALVVTTTPTASVPCTGTTTCSYTVRAGQLAGPLGGVVAGNGHARTRAGRLADDHECRYEPRVGRLDLGRRVVAVADGPGN